MRWLVCFLPVAICLGFSCGSATLAQSDASSDRPADEKTYLLRYKFRPGETVRWEVLQQSRVKTTVSGTTQVAEMVTRSTKVWRIKNADDGTFTFEHLVDDVDMWQKFTGRQEVRYKSNSDKQPPPGFEAIAQSIGVPIAEVTIDARGTILHRQRKPVKASVESDTLLAIPLPEEPVAVGHTWTVPYEFQLPLENGTVKKIKAVHRFELLEVTDHVATIKVGTKILTPIHDPALEAKLIQREHSGTVKFDIEAGRLLGQQMDLDRRVVGFSGSASSIHFVSRVTEKLLERQPRASTAGRPDLGESSTR